MCAIAPPNAAARARYSHVPYMAGARARVARRRSSRLRLGSFMADLRRDTAEIGRPAPLRACRIPRDLVGRIAARRHARRGRRDTRHESVPAAAGRRGGVGVVGCRRRRSRGGGGGCEARAGRRRIDRRVRRGGLGGKSPRYSPRYSPSVGRDRLRVLRRRGRGRGPAHVRCCCCVVVVGTPSAVRTT